MKISEIILEIIGWLQIVFATTIIAALIALPIYLKWSTRTGFVAAVSLVVIGFVAGSVWATIIWRKHGTVAWLSRIRKIS
jgi:hypothetical protein